VWPNIRNEEIRELEGLFRHIYRTDTHANQLNMIKTYNALRDIRKSTASALTPEADSYLDEFISPPKQAAAAGRRRRRA
jgi:hypothetical protein